MGRERRRRETALPISPGDLTIVLALSPFVAAALAPFLVRVLRGASGWVLALVPAAIFALLATLLPRIAAHEEIAAHVTWVPTLGLTFGIGLDGLSLLFALTIAGIGTLIILYSGAYLRGDPRLGRFLALLLAFMGAMLGIVLADGLVPLYIFWELTAVTSYLLIGFDNGRQSARRAALQALVITSAGGLCLLLGGVLLHAVTGQWDISALAAQHQAIAQSMLLLPICGLMFAAAFTKSAQFPLHFWLPNAMEAPTPVSAYLHSAAMVQAGIYLLARLSPVLSASPIWTPTLTLIGGLTLAWGALDTLKQTDLKQILARSTVSSLGLLVFLLGLGGEAAAVAVALYFLAHAIYKAGLFMVVGLIDTETGVRDITALGGLKDKMALAFIATILAAASMLGLPPALGYLAKEGVYATLGPLQWAELLVPVVLVGGNAILGAVALALVAKPFLGGLTTTPKEPQEGPVAMLVGPVALGVAGIGGAVLIGWTEATLIAPAAGSILGRTVGTHLGFAVNFADPVIWLSVATWLLSAAIYWKLGAVRTLLRRIDTALGWSFDRGFDAVIAGLLTLAHLFATRWQNGRLRFYLFVLFAAIAAALIVPLATFGGLPALPALPVLRPVEWAAIVLAIAGLAAVVLAPTLLVAILSLAVQGTAVALIYLLFGAPDLSFTQFMVETLSAVIFALVMVRLKLDGSVRRSAATALRDGLLAILCGGGVTVLLLSILQKPFDSRLGDFFAANAAALAHGRNIVNVILVDFRGLDTLGEISVVLTAGIGILALIASGRVVAGATPIEKKPTRRRRARKAVPATPEAAE